MKGEFIAGVIGFAILCVLSFSFFVCIAAQSDYDIDQVGKQLKAEAKYRAGRMVK